jgi:type IV pilus assembly protein PilM
MDLTKFRRSQARSLVGVDIGCSSVKVALIDSKGKDQRRLVLLNQEELPKDAIFEGSIQNEPAVARAIRRSLAGYQIRGVRAATALPFHAAVLRRFSIPSIPKNELFNSVKWEIGRYLPSDPSEFHIDYQLLPTSTSTQPREVLLAAARKEKIAELARVISLAGLVPAVIEIDVLTLLNLYLRNYESTDMTINALLDLGASSAKIAILQGGSLLFATSIPAELDSCYEHLAPELEEAFSLFQTKLHSSEQGSLYLCGGGSQIPGVSQEISNSVRWPIHILDPFKNLNSQHLSLKVGELNRYQAISAQAVGLALRMTREK